VFAARQLSATWALCPSTTDPDTVREWLTWASVGIEGVIFKRLDGVYEPSVRGWQKYKRDELQLMQHRAARQNRRFR
jgi:ATP-dependent DNA ligase